MHQRLGYNDEISRNHADHSKMSYIHMPDEIMNLERCSQRLQHALLLSYVYQKLGSISRGRVQKHPTSLTSSLAAALDVAEAASNVLAWYDSWVHAIAAVRKPLLILHWNGEPKAQMPLRVWSSQRVGQGIGEDEHHVCLLRYTLETYLFP